MAGGIELTWKERAPRHPPPPLSDDLTGWVIERRRPSHINARREHGGRTYHLKWFFHGPFRNPARDEWRGAALAAAAGVPVVEAVGWGVHRRGTFVLLAGVPGFPASAWRERGLDPASLGKLALALARQAAAFHDAGLCHRDFNVYHVYVDGDSLSWIDAGRVASSGRLRPRRWIVKDLASLLDTARREGFPHWLSRHFLRHYLRSTRRPWRRRRLLATVLAKAERYRRHNLKKARRGMIP